MASACSVVGPQGGQGVLDLVDTDSQLVGQRLRELARIARALGLQVVECLRDLGGLYTQLPGELGREALLALVVEPVERLGDRVRGDAERAGERRGEVTLAVLCLLIVEVAQRFFECVRLHAERVGQVFEARRRPALEVAVCRARRRA